MWLSHAASGRGAVYFIMKTETKENYLDGYMPSIADAIQRGEDSQARELIGLLIREVERDVRHAACDEVNKLHNTLYNISI